MKCASIVAAVLEQNHDNRALKGIVQGIDFLRKSILCGFGFGYIYRDFAIALLVVAFSTQTQAREPDALAGSTQMIAVTTSDWNAVEGHLQRYERANTKEPWHALGEPFSIVVGKSGLGWGIGVASAQAASTRSVSDPISGPIKREGDGRGPAGIFTLGTAFGDAAQPLPGLKLSYLELTPSIECVDDSSSKHYNRIVDRTTVSQDWKSSEHMREIGEAYHWGIVVNLNGTVPGGSAPKPDAGSCVFLHIWHSSSQGTAGCTAMPQADLESLLTWLDPAREPRLVQLPRQIYEQLAGSWKLPTLSGVSAR
jgi:D-alanyl-D-alanine dipeptidase